MDGNHPSPIAETLERDATGDRTRLRMSACRDGNSGEKTQESTNRSWGHPYLGSIGETHTETRIKIVTMPSERQMSRWPWRASIRRLSNGELRRYLAAGNR